ncbi:MAG: hypothetical protein K2N01_09810 [Lachnospiraceae bacterium]|nr:hypothetical protein [Lachnospiraceae bacterium]
MKQEERKGIRWRRVLVIFMAVMFVCTVLSKIADSLTIAKVEAEKPKSMKISSEIKTSGQVEKNRELAVLTQPDILVESVAVQSGDVVCEGDLLAQLDLRDLQSRMEDIGMQIDNYELTNRGLYSTARQQSDQRARNIQRAAEDYERIRREGQESVQQARTQLEEAKSALENAVDEEELPRLQENIAALQEAYESAAAQEAANNLNAERALQDAQAELPEDYSAQINEQSIEKLEHQLAQLQGLMEQEGRVTAPASGTITRCCLEVGQKTTDTASFTMTDEREGLRFVAEVDGSDGKYLSVGDTVTLKNSAGAEANLPIAAIGSDESGDKRRLTVMLPAGVFAMGETLSMTYVMESRKYETVVPLSALYQENQQYYVYIADAQNTLLGEAYVTRRMDVEVLEKNGEYAALTPSALDSDDKVITQTDRYVEAGERVRLTKK